MADTKDDVTRLLLAWRQGDKLALDALIPLVSDELRSIARKHLSKERPDHTLQPTALVNEVYLRLVDQRSANWQDRAHFFSFAALLMRRILVRHARKRGTQRRGGGVERVPFDDERDHLEGPDTELVALDDALAELARIDERQSRIVEMRFFAGLTHAEIGEALGVAEITVRRDFRKAKHWLYDQLATTSSPARSRLRAALGDEDEPAG